MSRNYSQNGLYIIFYRALDLWQWQTEFEAKFLIPQNFGSTDETHIRIRTSVWISHEYFNYKQFFTLSMQAVCDFQGHLCIFTADGLEVPTIPRHLQSHLWQAITTRSCSNSKFFNWRSSLFPASVLHERVSNMHNKRSYMIFSS